ncbi:MAG: hypothetical protein AAF830_17745, partial [Pseudomonadota bacterium]
RALKDTSAAWRDGFIVIDDIPLGEALAEIDRYRPGFIMLAPGTAAQGRVTARLSIWALDTGLAAVAASQGLSIARLTDYLIILH